MALVNWLNANLVRKWITQRQTQTDTSISSVVRTSADGVALVPVAPLNESVQIESHKARRAEESTDGRSRIEMRVGYAYLRTVFKRIADHPINRIDELLPWRLIPVDQHVQQTA